MGRDPGEQATPDLFSTNTVREASPSPPKPISAAKTAAFPQRYILPKNLGRAVKQLSDSELDQLFKVTFDEAKTPRIATRCCDRFDTIVSSAT